MELFGILFSVPAAFLATSVYAGLLVRFVAGRERLSRLFTLGSALVFMALMIEIVLLLGFGAVESRRMLGPSFYVGHTLVFILGVPALANVLLLRFRRRFRWFSVALACSVFALGLVLLQYSVSESLYGIDGTNGPFSSRTPNLGR